MRGRACARAVDGGGRGAAQKFMEAVQKFKEALQKFKEALSSRNVP
jgi:hypothetical protein